MYVKRKLVAECICTHSIGMALQQCSPKYCSNSPVPLQTTQKPNKKKECNSKPGESGDQRKKLSKTSSPKVGSL